MGPFFLVRHPLTQSVVCVLGLCLIWLMDENRRNQCISRLQVYCGNTCLSWDIQSSPSLLSFARSVPILANWGLPLGLVWEHLSLVGTLVSSGTSSHPVHCLFLVFIYFGQWMSRRQRRSQHLMSKLA